MSGQSNGNPFISSSGLARDDVNTDVMSAVLVEAPDMSAVSVYNGLGGSPGMKGVKGVGGGKKLKKYKNNAEKVFSLFSSPRQVQTQEKEKERQLGT